MAQQLRRRAPPPCSIEVEDVWGPQVKGCGSDFDLTLLFQEVFLSAAPLGLAICLATWSVSRHIGQKVMVASPFLYGIKVSIYVLAILAQIALVVLQAILKTSLTRATIVVSIIGIIGFVILLVVSHYEHRRSVRASTVLLLYLGLLLPADAMRARTLWSMPSDNTPIAITMTAFCGCKFALLILEWIPKRVREGVDQPTPDERANIVSRSFIWWLLPLFSLGKKTLTSEKLPDIEPTLTRLGKVPNELGEPEKEKDQSGLNGRNIFAHLFAARRSILLSAVPPRLAYMGFMYTQPFLVERATAYMSEPMSANIYRVGGGLIAAYSIVYVGIAVTQAFYRQCTARAITAIRADLVIMVHSHTLKLSNSSTARDAASTLMSADVEQFAAGSRNMHECWACIIELGIGLWLLEQQLGLSVAATGGLTIAFVLLTMSILPTAAKRQNKWLKTMENRIAATTQSIQAMKGVKMTGVTATIRKDLMGFRAKEVRKLRLFRYMLLVAAWAMWIPVIMSPILGFTLYTTAFHAGSLSPAMVYRCLTIFGLFGNSIANLLDSLIKLVTTVAALLRIQSFLLSNNTRIDPRELISLKYPPKNGSNETKMLPPLPPVSPLSMSRPTSLVRRMSLVPTTTIASPLVSSRPGSFAPTMLSPWPESFVGPVSPQAHQQSRSRVSRTSRVSSITTSSPLESPHNFLTNLRRLSQIVSRAPAALQLSQASAGWVKEDEKSLTVRDADLNISSPSIVAVVGPIGSGKTTLLQMILGETERADGSIAVSSFRTGYCSQTPWLINETIRDNIIGSDPLYPKWYRAVLHACALERDIRMMPLGDSTKVADGGGSLSGGQRKRIALARAIYSRAPIILLDDPFNGLDGRTENIVLEAVLGSQGLLRQSQSLVIWTTSTGKQASISALRPRHGKFDTGAVQQVRVADRVITLTETGHVRKRDSLLASVRRTDESEEGFERTAAKERRLSDVVQGILTGSVPVKRSTSETHGIVGSMAVYEYFITFSGRIKFLIFTILCAIFVFGMTFSQYWVVRWAASSAIDPSYRQWFYIGIYFGLGSVQLIAWTAAAYYFIVNICEISAERLHAALVDTVLKAPMSFFDTTAAGDTINRFSQDLQLIDTALPLDILGFVTQVMIVIGTCALIVYGSPLSGTAIPLVGVAVYFIQRAYLPTSRQLRVLEIEAKGPLFSNFIETLNGLATIRALRWMSDYASKNLEAVKISQKPFFLLFSAQNWLNLVLDLVTAGLAVAIMSIGVATRTSANSSTLGLALLSAANIGMSAKQLITHWTQLEISMAAVERIRAFSHDTPSEVVTHPEGRDSKSTMDSEPKGWHGAGSVVLSNVYARYTPDAPLALKNISFTVRPGERLAICGRTGSGKSTILGALLRLLPIHDGMVLVDDADISRMDPDDVRSRFITLPQEPLLINGSVRHNMQLYESQCGDQEIIAALDDFGLWETIESKGGLDVTLNEELLSHGQRQLFCFARSTLQRGNIVILDEPTSQSDRVTEQKMDLAIREKFKRHTVLCIAHKLATILSFDTVLVMDAGSIVESGNPRALLQDSTSWFSTLMQSQTRLDE